MPLTAEQSYVLQQANEDLEKNGTALILTIGDKGDCHIHVMGNSIELVGALVYACDIAPALQTVLSAVVYQFENKQKKKK